MTAEVRVSSVYTPDGHLAPVEARCRACQTHRLYRPGRCRTSARAEIRPRRYKQRTSRHGTPRSDVRNRENRLTSGTSTLSAGRSDRRRDVSAGLESQPAWTVPLRPSAGRHFWYRPGNHRSSRSRSACGRLARLPRATTVTVISKTSHQLIASHTIDPDRNYWRKQRNAPADGPGDL